MFIEYILIYDRYLCAYTYCYNKFLKVSHNYAILGILQKIVQIAQKTERASFPLAIVFNG